MDPLSARRVVPGLAFVLAVGLLTACGGSAKTLRELREQTVCTLDLPGSRLDLVPGPGVHVSARLVSEEDDDARHRLRELLDEDEPTGLARVLVQTPRPLLGVVIDDLGLHPNQIAGLWSLGQPLTWALLPHATHSAAYASWLAEAGASIMIHLPMEPEETRHMTLPGYLRHDATPAERARHVREALEALPDATSLNNHMGSRLTADAAIMAEVIAQLPDDMVVLDSRTTPDSQLAAAGVGAGHPVARRTTFIDNERSHEAILAQLEVTLEHARKEGSAVAIGHPYPETVEALRTFLLEHGHEVHLVPIEAIATPATPSPWVRRCREAASAATPE